MAVMLFLSLPALACGETKSHSGAADGGADARSRTQVFPPWNGREVDILFMIDNSGSMTAPQQALIANFPDYGRPT
ncbi:MAG TPA: hypothetical protein VFH73_00225 [Polyangia bacterium]|nr:hypothetical protein [Polyangia bacterium]